jgi:hypothetical protein
VGGKKRLNFSGFVIMLASLCQLQLALFGQIGAVACVKLTFFVLRFAKLPPWPEATPSPNVAIRPIDPFIPLP